MKLKLKKWQIALILAIVLLVVLNPTISDFRGYLGYTSNKGLKKTSNFLIFSTFQNDENKYFGIVKNFFEIYHQPEPEAAKDSTVTKDSTVVGDH